MICLPCLLDLPCTQTQEGGRRQGASTLTCFCAWCVLSASCHFSHSCCVSVVAVPVLFHTRPNRHANRGNGQYSKSDRLLFQKITSFCLWLWFVCNSGNLHLPCYIFGISSAPSLRSLYLMGGWVSAQPRGTLPFYKILPLGISQHSCSNLPKHVQQQR